MRVRNVSLLLLLGLAMGCGGENGDLAGAGGSGGDPPAEQSAYVLGCTIDTLVLEIPIELIYKLDRPYAAGMSAELTLSATITFSEGASTTLIDAGIEKVDIVSLGLATSVMGATPPAVPTSFVAAPINDFDLALDTDDNGFPGPHHFRLDDVTVASTVMDGATNVELGLSLDLLSMVLGDFDVPRECGNPTLVGFSAAFPVDP